MATITLTPSIGASYEFACHSAACAPPSAGGTGGSNPGKGGGSYKGVAQFKGGVVTHEGKALTTKASQSAGQWRATLKSSKQQVIGRTRAELVSNAIKAQRLHEATGRSQGALNQASHTNYRAGALKADHAEALARHGSVKAKDISIGKDGTVKIKGKAEESTKITRHGTGWSVTGVTRRTTQGGDAPKVFKTQAAAKMEVSKLVNAAHSALAPSSAANGFVVRRPGEQANSSNFE